MLDNTDMTKYDVIAKEISALGIDLFDNKIIGPQFCILLKKK